MERAGHPGARPLRVLPAPGAAGPAMAEVTLADGGVYKGELKCEAPHGQGSCAWPDGSKYEGEWRSGKMHGKGAFQAGSTRTSAHSSRCDTQGRGRRGVRLRGRRAACGVLTVSAPLQRR